MDGFVFKLNQKVGLVESTEVGAVIGRAQYAHAENSYYVRYKAGDGRQTEAWWGESAITAVAK